MHLSEFESGIIFFQGRTVALSKVFDCKFYSAVVCLHPVSLLKINQN